MAKIFSNIAKDANGLRNVYDDSTLNEQESPFSYARKLAIPGGPIDVSVASIEIRRIAPIYDLFTSKTQSTLTFDANKLLITSTVRKLNRTTNSTLYDRFSTNNPYITNGTQILPENGTLIEIKPYSKDVADQSLMLQDSQSLPIVSGPRDEKRLINYLKTSEGLFFLARQQVLQAGNTFKQSRRYNPVSVVLAASKYALANLNTPLERVDRALSLDSQSTSKTIPQMITISDMAGRLQQETVLQKQEQLRIRFVGGQRQGSNRRTLLGQVVGTAANRLLQSILNRTNVNVFGRRINLGQLGRTLNTLGQTVQAIGRGINIGNATLKTDQTPYDALIQANLWPLVKNKDGTVQNFHINKKNYIERAQKSLNVVKQRGKLNNNFFTKPYPDIEEDYRSSESYTDDVQTEVGSFNGITSAKYIKDPMNLTPSSKPIGSMTQLDGLYSREDFIQFRIVVPGVFDQGVSFRAFVEDLRHDAKGDYEEQRYVGRPERFVVYKGMTRSMKFKVYLVAFTKDELATVWLRANMLNKLVYPINTAAGHMVPPIAKLTLGNIIENQPGYFTDINMDLDDVPWDIDSEVTQVVKLDMSFNIIEKNFITQDQTSNALLDADPFANTVIKDQITKNIGGVLSGFKMPNIDIPQVNLNPASDPLRPELLSRDIQNITTRLGERAAREDIQRAGFQGLVNFARNGSVGRG